MQTIIVNTASELIAYARKAGHKIGNFRNAGPQLLVDFDGETMACMEARQFLRDNYTFQHVDGRIMPF